MSDSEPLQLKQRRLKMYVRIEFIIKTEDFEAKEFKKEIKTLIKDIDPNVRLVSFDMHEVK